MKKKWKEMGTLNKILLILAIFLFTFIITMCVFFAIYQTTPDTLIVAVLGGGGIETIMTAFIQISKIRHKKEEELEVAEDNEEETEGLG